MLILTRRLGESINVGDDVKISVLGISGKQVRIGIEAPNNVVVHWEEIFIKVQEENRKAQEKQKKSLRTSIGNMIKKIKP